MNNKKQFVRCRHFLLSICLMLTAYEVNGGLSDHLFIFTKSSGSFNAISVNYAGVTRRTLTLGEEENFIIAEEIRLNGLTGRLRVSATDYVTHFLFLTPDGRAAIAANPDAITQAEALSFTPFLQDYYPLGTVGTLLSNNGITRSEPYNQQGHDPLKAQLPGSLYINPSISMSTARGGEQDSTALNDVLVLTFSNTDTTLSPQSFHDRVVVGRVLQNGSYRLTIRIGQLDRPFTFHVPEQLILNPVKSFYVPSPTPEVPVPKHRALPSVRVPQPGQSEVSQANERTDADIAMAVYFYPRRGSQGGSATQPSNQANTDIIFVQRSGPAEATDLNSPNEENETSSEEETIKFSFFSMHSAVLAAVKKRKENQNSAPDKKNNLKTARRQMTEAMAHLQGYHEELADFTDETKDISLLNPKDIEQLIHYTRLLIQLHSDYIASGKMTNRTLINNVDRTLIYSRVIAIWFLHRLESESLVTSGGLEGSDVLPVQLLAELCDGLQPNQTKLNALEYSEKEVQALLNRTYEFVLKLLVRLTSTYRKKQPTFTLAVANVWQDLRRIISFLNEHNVFDKGMTTVGVWSTKYELSIVATEMGDIDTLLLLMQLTEEELKDAGPEHFLEIRRLFGETQLILMMILQRFDLPSTNFTSFIKSAKLLELDTSPLENAIEKQKQDRASALAEKSEKIKQKADTWAEEEKRKSDKLRKKMQDYQKAAQSLREKRHQAAKQHDKKPEPQSPAITTATANKASEKNTVKQNSGQSLYEQGRQAFTEERFKDALQHYLDVLSITSDPLQRARIMSSIADCYFFWGNFASRLRDLLAKAYDYYEDAQWAALSGNYPKLDKADFFKLLRTIIATIDDDLIESVRQAYRWHVEAIDELQGITEEKNANYDASEIEELLSLLILEAEDQDNLANTIKDGVITLNEASELRRQAINNKKPEQRQSQREEENKLLKQLTHLQEKVTSQPVKGKGKEKGKKKGKKKGQPAQSQHPVEAEPSTSIETELQRLETGEASYQQQLSKVLAGFREGIKRATQIKRLWEKKTQRSELSASGASASDTSKASPPSGKNHDLSQSQLSELLNSGGIRGYRVFNVPYNNWCMFDALERWLNLLSERDSSVNNPNEGFELFYRLAHRAKMMANYEPDDPELNQIAATFHVDGPGRQAWGTTEILHRLIAPVLNLNILVLGVDFSEGYPILTSAMYSRDAITPVPPEERDSAINEPDTIALLHINNHWQAVLPVARPAEPASTGGNATATDSEQVPPVQEPGLHRLEPLTPEVPLLKSL
ncbi:hypothetical protein NX722_07450 [Endozoicomonas gorgoniicola]|uniref:Tetratricopeptide repeat protein n=1 Tax=Endozoicomonas gorgoniicola TaxID=1234144 RepID=A0ABT3MSZ2_9GAMM|nr:hypothetical protein [Endozoicomonas gorgoniicola]MCW7552482.1 hypothetical protein [Endozoicomonas gorgoniicola]